MADWTKEERDAVAEIRSRFTANSGDFGMAEALLALQIEATALRDALAMIYEKYEDGDSCTENGDPDGSYMGNCVRLDGPEEDSILKLLPKERQPAKLPADASPSEPQEQRKEMQRWAVHYDSMPHACQDPLHCDCNCKGCVGSRGFLVFVDACQRCTCDNVTCPHCGPRIAARAMAAPTAAGSEEPKLRRSGWMGLTPDASGNDNGPSEAAPVASQAPALEEVLAKVYEGRLLDRDSTRFVTVAVDHETWRAIQQLWYKMKREANHE